MLSTNVRIVPSIPPPGVASPENGRIPCQKGRCEEVPKPYAFRCPRPWPCVWRGYWRPRYVGATIEHPRKPGRQVFHTVRADLLRLPDAGPEIKGTVQNHIGQGKPIAHDEQVFCPKVKGGFLSGQHSQASFSCTIASEAGSAAASPLNSRFASRC